MKNNNIKLYVILGLISAVLMFVADTLQLKMALNGEFELLSDMLSVLLGGAFGFLIARVKILGQKVEVTTITDHLTSLYNRKWLNRHFKEQVDQYQRYQIGLSIILLDIDQFKKLNDTYGHNAGDEVLVKVAQLIRESSRTTDAYGRWSGEEFLIMLPNTKLEGANSKAEAIRKAIADEVFSIGQVTCSFGVAEITTKEQQPHDLVKLADGALSEAKNNGRNRVCTAA